MTDSQQNRPLTADEQFRMLFDRTAKLNDIASALLDPNWGANAGIIPEGHPLYPETLEPLPGSIAKKPRLLDRSGGEQAAPVDWQAIVKRHERELKTVGEQKQAVEAERDGAYRERNRTVTLAAAGLAETVVVAPALDVDEPGWQILYATLNGRQASWHFGPRDADLIAHFEHIPADDPRARWDGHTTEEKYAGIAAWTAELAQRCGPACAEQHTETGRCEIARNR